jgi:hypothetical protein
VTEEWDRTGELFQREEAVRIGILLEAQGLEEVRLNNKDGRLRAHYVRGKLIFPRERAAPSIEFHEHSEPEPQAAPQVEFGADPE